MNEHRRLKIKIGNAELETDVPKNEVQPMYDLFVSILEGRRTSLFRQISRTNGKAFEQPPRMRGADRAGFASFPSDPNDPLKRVFELSDDGAILLKVLPKGPHQNVDAVILLLYGYHQLKKEERVLTTELMRAAGQSGIFLRTIAAVYAGNRGYMVRGGVRKGSYYALNTEGLAMAKEIMATILCRNTESTAASPVEPYLQSLPLRSRHAHGPSNELL